MDEEEFDRLLVKTELKTLAVWAQKIVSYLTDEGYSLELENDPYDYPRLRFFRKDSL